MIGRALLGCATALAVLAAANVAPAADVPPHLSHQGVLTDANGVVVADGGYALKFEIFDAPSAGNVLFSQEVDIQVAGGLYNVLLSDSGGPGTLAQAFENPTTYLQITITDVPQGSPITPPEALSPRQKFASVPYALVAPQADPSRVLVDSFDANNNAVADLSLPAGFDRFEIELIDVYPVSTSPVEFHAQVSADGGSTHFESSGDYDWTWHVALDGFEGWGSAGSTSEIQLGPDEMLKNAPGKAFNGRVTILNPGGGNSFFTLMVEGVHYGADTNSAVLTRAGGQLVSTLTRVDSIRFKVSSGNLGGGRFRVYGLP